MKTSYSLSDGVCFHFAQMASYGSINDNPEVVLASTDNSQVLVEAAQHEATPTVIRSLAEMRHPLPSSRSGSETDADSPSLSRLTSRSSSVDLTGIIIGDRVCSGLVTCRNICAARVRNNGRAVTARKSQIVLVSESLMMNIIVLLLFKARLHSTRLHGWSCVNGTAGKFSQTQTLYPSTDLGSFTTINF